MKQQDTSIIELKPVDVKGIEEDMKSVPALFKKCDNIIITSQDHFEQAGGLLKIVKSRYKELETQRKEIISPMDAAKKKVMELFKKPLDLLSSGESKIKSAMLEYSAEVERKRVKEQKKLIELAEKEKAKEEKKIDKRIEKAIENGNEEKAATLQEQKENLETIQVPVIDTSVDAVAGISFRDNWIAKIVDESLIPREYLIPDMAKLNKVAKAMKGTLQVPGISFVNEKIIISRSGE